MTSSLVTIANDVAAMVSAVEIDGVALTATVDLAPELDIPKIRERKLLVTPQSYSSTNATRGESSCSAKINIGWFEKVKLSDAPDKIAAMETIAKALERKATSTGIVTAVEFDPMYDASVLRSMNVFISICTVTVKVIK